MNWNILLGALMVFGSNGNPPVVNSPGEYYRHFCFKMSMGGSFVCRGGPEIVTFGR